MKIDEIAIGYINISYLWMICKVLYTLFSYVLTMKNDIEFNLISSRSAC